jgi:hypothetical protein
LAVPEGLERDSEQPWDAADTQGWGKQTWERHGVETLTCVHLLRACEKSLETGAAITFG